ncbi:MAG: hypothetical protein EBX41_07480, partial [Chitinophagia bacterium]|nr:hypothetical protein [Chitinophagia bacterium]
MKLKLTALFTLVCTVLATTVANATHIFGADLLYKHISGNTYQIILTLYGDCSADATLFGQLSTATPNVLVYRGATLFTDTLKLRSINGGIEVSPVCPSRIRDTKCSGGLLPGIKQFTYIDTIDLRGTHTGWRFVFNGKLGGTYQAGRSGNITNAYSGTVMQIEATLNNTNGPNNSPVYSTIPTPFYCLNLLQEYNQGATDPDADSLAFSLVPGVDASSSGAPVNYVFPYTAAAPLSTAAGTFRFSDINGQLTFNPDIVQDALVVNKVYEYERGVLVGTSEREMTFIVLDNCGGNPPSSQLNHVVGATVTDGNIINICKGAPFVSFDIDIINPDSDYVKLGYSGLPGASRLNIFNDSTAHPYASFAWNTDTLTTGNYTFFLKIKNNHCPLISNQTVAYTIKVSNKPTINTEQLSPTECVHRSYIKFNLAEGYKPRTVSIYKDGTLVNRITDTADAVFDSLAAGDYTAIVSSDSLCSSTTVFAVADSGRLPLSGFNKTVCKNDTPIQLYVPLLAAGAVIQWYDIAGTPLST